MHPASVCCGNIMGSWLRVQARLSRIYIYIKAANPPELHCSCREQRSELLRSRLRDQTVVSLLFRSLSCCSLHWNAPSKMFFWMRSLHCLKCWRGKQKFGFMWWVCYWSQGCINAFVTLHHISQEKHIMRILNSALNHFTFIHHTLC